ncbi:MAG: DNA translocase FtsK, partial [Deltaproteobacteria bacterium]|nr:DNA translocase FtsK [Deltaproteobacteria bacterium]
MATTTARGRATKKRQAPKRKKEQDSPKLLGTGQMQNEAGSVILGCVGLLTLLALASYHPGDASLNAGGGEVVRNWIGTAGGYWADLLLQIMGMGAFPFGAGLLIAGWRALFGKRLIPGVREAIGSLLLMVSVGTFAHLVLAGQARPYPPGGVVGAVLGQMLYQHLALVGSVIVSGAMVLISMALTFDGIVGNIGLQGAGMIRRSALKAQGSLVMFRERSQALKERRAELKEKRAEKRAQKEEWTLGEQVEREEREANDERAREQEQVNVEKEREEREKEREEVLEKARVKGREMAEKQAEKELAKRARADQETIGSDSSRDFSVDLQDEEGFELGCIPGVTEPRVVERSESTALVPVSFREEDLIELEPEDVEEDTPILSAAGPVEQLEPSEEAFELPLAQPEQAMVHLGVEEELAPQIVDVRKDADEDAIEEAIYLAETEGTREEVLPTAAYELPSINLLDLGDIERTEIDTQKLQANAVKLTSTLKDYKIEGTVREIRPGPVVTMYEYVPTAGTKVSKISNLADDLAMSMEALRVRIVAPIPGKGAVGIEIPNETRETVFFKELVAHENFRKSKSKLPIALGKDIEGNAKVVDLARMPHLLVAGATGSGKSVFVNSLIMSILYKSTPDEVRFIMVDPKMLELSVYNAVSHLLLPVVVDPKK